MYGCELHIERLRRGVRLGNGATSPTFVAAYTNSQGSAVYVCSLDAEKCFDSIWHVGLFYKLIDTIPDSQWLFLYSWYESSHAQIRWKNEFSRTFRITKGMKQGSILSPHLFNVFINDLLLKLESSNHGVRIQNFHLNVLAYADDLNLLCTTASGLQALIDLCEAYAHKWRMRFNPTKTNIICIGKQSLKTPPLWTLGDTQVELSEDAVVLGVTFTSSLHSAPHVKSRIRKCQQGMFKLSSMGLSYPGLNSDVKAFLWNSIGSPILTYGMESIQLSKSNIKELKTTQGNIIKRVMGINKRSHNSDLLKALSIPSIEDLIQINCLRLYKNVFKTDTPAKDLQSVLLANYILNGRLVKGTLLYRVVESGQKPISIIFDKKNISTSFKYDHSSQDNGIIDSLRYLLNHEDYNKPWSEEHILATLLTKAY